MADTTREIKAFTAISNRYVVDGSALTCALYETTLSPERLTFGQLISAVSLRLGAANEARAVLAMNRLTNNIGFATLLSAVVKKLTEEPDGDNKLAWDTDVWKMVDGLVKKDDYSCRSELFAASPTLENFVLQECGVTSTTTLPGDDDDAGKKTENLNTTRSRLDAYALLRPVMEEVTRASEVLQVDVETDISRRDVAMTTASNIIKAFAASLLSAAQAMK